MSWSELTAFYHHADTQHLVLVTLVEKQGSSYRQPGARMLVRQDGASCGSVSAGCLEEEITRAATPVHHDGRPRLLTIDTRPHYGCPGQITLLLEALEPAAGQALFQVIASALRARQPFTVTTSYADLAVLGPLTHAQLGATTGDPAENSYSGVLRERVGRQPRLVVVGTGTDAAALAKTALLAQWEVHGLGPDEIKFSPVQLATRYPPDDRTAIILVTHNLGHDVACLHEILPLPYSYIGVIGSRHRRRELIMGLESVGAHAALTSLDRLCCPAGLDLGAGTAGEIAISILAEIQSRWAGRNATPLRDRTQPIHPHA